MIKNYKELQSVKKEVKDRIHEIEADYMAHHQWIRVFLDASGVHKGKKNSELRSNLHASIVQGVSEYLKENKIFSKYKNEYITILIPFVITALSALILKKI
ncbi:MAG: hypothetical protein R6U19_07250 [Bacteroidales bacterium]